jgi:hypothetical protein
VSSIFPLLFHHENLADSGLAQDWYLMLREPRQKSTAKNKQNRKMAERWFSPKQDGSQERPMCPLRLEGSRVV